MGLALESQVAMVAASAPVVLVEALGLASAVEASPWALPGVSRSAGRQLGLAMAQARLPWPWVWRWVAVAPAGCRPQRQADP